LSGGVIKSVFVFFISAIFLFATNLDQNQSKKQELKWNNLKTTFISKKEEKYQEYRKNLEEENRILEEDGFCSCNNN